MQAKGKQSENTFAGGTEMAPCRHACPAGIDVPRYIRHIAKGDFSGALAVIREKIPFPAVCGHACVHPCEARCARRQYDEPIAIRMLKRAAEAKGKTASLRLRKPKPTGKRVAVVGSGPCGLTAAYYLACLGHDVTVFEAQSMAGGMLRYAIPAYRLPNEVLERDIDGIRARGVAIKTDALVESAQALLSQGFDAVLAAAGAWQPLRMGIAGEDSGGVVDGLSFLREVNSGKRRSVGRVTVVVGGGNTAVDAARTAVRLGAETLLIYRRSRAEMPALTEEVAQAEEEGVQLRFMTAPVRIDRDRVVCVKMKPGPEDESGRRKPLPITGSEFSLTCDTVIVAVGQRPAAAALQLEQHADGTARVDGLLATPLKGVFAAGDAVSGPKSIIDAIAQGRLAGMSIDRYLGGRGNIDPQKLPDPEAEYPDPVPKAVSRQKCETLPPDVRTKGFDLVETGFDEAGAMQEAARCLACDLHRYRVEIDAELCKGCGYCMEMCGLGVFSPANVFNAGGYKPLAVKAPDRCAGCLKCVYVCPDLAIRLKKK